MRTEGLLEIDLLTINVKLTLTADPLPRGGGIPIYWLYGYVPLEREWFSSHLVWYSLVIIENGCPPPPTPLTSILYFPFNIQYRTTHDLTTAFRHCLLKWNFEQSNRPTKCIDIVRVKHENIIITHHLSMHTPFVVTIFHL